MTARARFTQADVKRAMSGVMQAGMTIAQLTIDPDGRIAIIPDQMNDNGVDRKDKQNEWADLE